MGKIVIPKRNIPENVKEYNQEQNQITLESTTEALLILLEKEEYEDISVTHLCNKAGISRNAFYKNFKTKDNVIKMVLSNFMHNIVNKFGSPLKDAGKEWYKNFFKTVKEHCNFFETLSKMNFFEKFLESMGNIISGDEEDKVKGEQKKYSLLMWSGAIYNTTANWIKSGMKESFESMAEMCYNMLKFFKFPQEVKAQ